MSMLERFQKRLAASNQTAILHDKKIEIKEEEEKKEEEEEKKFGIDLDAEDTVGDDWWVFNTGCLLFTQTYYNILGVIV